MHAYDSDVLVMCTGAAPTSLITAMDLLALVFPAATAAGRRGPRCTVRGDHRTSRQPCPWWTDDRALDRHSQ